MGNVLNRFLVSSTRTLTPLSCCPCLQKMDVCHMTAEQRHPGLSSNECLPCFISLHYLIYLFSVLLGTAVMMFYWFVQHSISHGNFLFPFFQTACCIGERVQSSDFLIPPENWCTYRKLGLFISAHVDRTSVSSTMFRSVNFRARRFVFCWSSQQHPSFLFVL